MHNNIKTLIIIISVITFSLFSCDQEGTLVESENKCNKDTIYTTKHDTIYTTVTDTIYQDIVKTIVKTDTIVKTEIRTVVKTDTIFVTKEGPIIIKMDTVFKSKAEPLTIKFDSRFGNEDFALNKDFTLNGKTYNYKHLRYWLSNVYLVKEDGTKFEIPNSYYLMGENSDVDGGLTDAGTFVYPANKREDLDLMVPSGKYIKIEFSIGVDAKYNDNLSLQAGELSHGSGMDNISWMWLTSYIFTKAEGTVTSNGTTKNFVADTGLNKNYRTVTLDSDFEVVVDVDNKVEFNLAVEKIFNGLDVFTTTKINAGTDSEMTQLSDNFSNVFISK